MVFYKRGQAAIAMVLLVGGISLAVGVGLAFLVASFTNTSFGYQSSQRALSAASAGTSDAMLRLVRNKDFSSVAYTVPVEAYNVSVTVTQNDPSAGQATIVSQATVSGYKRKVQTTVVIDQVTGTIHIVASKIIL